MRVIGFLLKYSWGLLLLAIGASIVAGLSNVLLVALINVTLTSRHINFCSRALGFYRSDRYSGRRQGGDAKQATGEGVDIGRQRCQQTGTTDLFQLPRGSGKDLLRQPHTQFQSRVLSQARKNERGQGGQTDVLLEVASNFFPEAVSFGGFKNRTGAIEQTSTHHVAPTYAGAVVILVDEESASASEVFTASMQEHGRARVVGRQTCGCVLNQASKTLSRGVLRWSSRVYFSPQGRLLEGSGITPDTIVQLTISDLQHHHDKAFQVAESLLKAKNSDSASRT